MSLSTLELRRRQKPNVCSYCGWDMVLMEGNRWSCQNASCFSVSSTARSIIEATDAAADFDNVPNRGAIRRKAQPS